MKREYKDNVLSYYTTYQGKEILLFRKTLCDKDEFETDNLEDRVQDYIIANADGDDILIQSSADHLYVLKLSVVDNTIAVAPIVGFNEKTAEPCIQENRLLFMTNTQNMLNEIPELDELIGKDVNNILSMPIRNTVYTHTNPEQIKYDFMRQSIYDKRQNIFAFNSRLDETEAEFCLADNTRVSCKIYNQYEPDEYVISTDIKTGDQEIYYTRQPSRIRSFLTDPKTWISVCLGIFLGALLAKCAAEQVMQPQQPVPVIPQPPVNPHQTQSQHTRV